MRSKLQKLLNRLDNTNETTLGAIRDFEGGVKTLREKLQKEIEASTLSEVNLKINKLRKSIDLDPIVNSLQNLESNFEQSILSIFRDIEVKSKELGKLTSDSTAKSKAQSDTLTSEISKLKRFLEDVVSAHRTELNLVNNDLTTLITSSKNLATKEELQGIKAGSEKATTDLSKKTEESVKEVNDNLFKFRIDLLNKLAEKGGGHANRQVLFNGTDYLKRFTDYNLIAGNNVNFTIAENQTAKRVNITIASSGSGGGRVRLIQSVAINTVMGASADTDYVYLVSGTTTMTLPTGVGNDNQYTVKNVGVGTVTIDTTGGETIDGNLTITMPVQFTSVDLISDTANWNIT